MSETEKLEGAQCAVHGAAAAAAACERCGNYACAVCVVSDPRGKSYCSACAPAALSATYSKHVWVTRLIGAVYLISGGMLLAPGVQMCFILSRLLAGTSTPLNAPEVQRLGGGIGVVLAAAIYLGFTGWTLRAFRPSARFLALVPLTALLFLFPIGSLLGLSAILLLLGPGGRFVFSNAYTRKQPRRVISEVATWFVAVLLVLVPLIISQYGSLSRAISAGQID